MTEQLVLFLVGLYFVGVGLPSLTVQPLSLRNGNFLQFIYGVVLTLLAYFGVQLLR